MKLQRVTQMGAALALVFATLGCGDNIEEPAPAETMRVGDSRDIELRYTQFNVQNFEQTLTKADLAKLPQKTKDKLWLLDLDIAGGKASPKLLNFSLEKIKNLNPTELSGPARNMQRLLKMTPSNADLSGTSFEALLNLAPILGVSTEKVLADMLNVETDDTFLSTDAVAKTILRNVISTHPNAFERLGPITAEHPDGRYPVAEGSMPVTLADAASDFGTLSRRFGEYYRDGVYHPGFIVGDVKGKVFEDDFQMTVRTNANALPYKGVDLTYGATASVNSIASQIQNLFDVTDPNWLRIQGLKQSNLTIDEMTFQIVEADAFIPGGHAPDPAPWGESPVWQYPKWTIQRILVDASLESFHDLNSFIRYDLPTGNAAMTMSVDNGWASVETAGGLGAPPRPQYIWDLLLEVGQVRMHDGGIPQGEANVQFTLKDVPVGYNSEEIEAIIRQNLTEDPSILLDVAAGLLDSTEGNADFYYYRPSKDTNEELQGDYLYFVAPQDIGLDDDGNPTREYNYERIGFYKDEELSERISTDVEIDGDTSHQKIKLEDNMTFYVLDDANYRYKIKVLPKESERVIRLNVTRIQ